MLYIDLHTHSTASDGTDTPEELVIKAKESGLSSLALTDHDTILGLAEAQEQALKSNIEFIRGCEMSVFYEGMDIHILGLWLPHSNTLLDEMLAKLRQYKQDRDILILKRLDELGLHLKYEDVLAMSQGESIVHFHLAQLMVQKGFAKNTRECFEKYLGEKGQIYEPKKVLDAQEVISLLAHIGATVSLAHPCIIGLSYKKIETMVAQFKQYGLSSIEAYHSEQNKDDQIFCMDLAKKYNLTVTGGSDYHGLAKPQVKLGRTHGNTQISARVLDVLKEQRVKCGLSI